ncbi:MAG: hypothetical protein BWY83_01733 [bacterium ADurb.Bin478]|nr:MAG: hypothetical protein BWY83_01733 [bacterium ADurb.Bin478]
MMVNSTGAGRTLNNRPPPKKLKEAGKPNTGTPPVNSNAAPRAIPMMPSVAINGGR